MNTSPFLVQNSLYLTTLLGAICTLGIFSLLYKENPIYRLFEHVFIGLATGYGVYLTIKIILYPLWWKRMVEEGHWYWIFALLAGSMFYFVYSRKYVWISRIIFGVFMGLEAGAAFKGFSTEFIPQIFASFKPLYAAHGVTWWDVANNLVFVTVLFTAMAYFFFSVDHKHTAVRKIAGTGRWFLMFAFGAMFGATVGGRMSLLIGRIDFLLRDWLHII
ncbi:MAG: hypothetical protein Q7N50_08190 [Armatimonadota bacterium]|nr:hypothetical protein [Armatimonadota bacterium]